MTSDFLTTMRLKADFKGQTFSIEQSRLWTRCIY